MTRTTAVLVTSLALAACTGSGSSTESEPKKTDEPKKLAGVYPENFRCDTIATADVLGGVLGGSVRQLDTPSSIPRGVPHPCNYEVQFPAGEAVGSAAPVAPPPEYWTFDFDCRDGYKDRADALFTQYSRTSGELVQQYNSAADAAPILEPAPRKKDPKKNQDAGIDAPQRAPEEAAAVSVGAKGLDHHGQGILFVDDDAPCYVRVVGPDKDRRLALAQLVAKNLTFANAPMTPRPFK